MLDGAVAVFCAVGGVEPQSETVWRQADKYRVPRIAFVNKMDRVGADFDRVVQHDPASGSAPTRCRSSCRSAARSDFRGVIDLVTMKAMIWDDESLGAKYHVEDDPGEL